ncbi:MAG: WecB/TagA/CpsF family glycosyltransferase [Thermoanaerobaculia bacterium]|nr:WecB/TagA/CpsF family glycosyltransferase [Thermoanaerobaculia bacterium]MBP9823675.1 WecB/TagA/CpsF family glycosyltransferase [Thermoanaerobaculia bacterium]
MSDGPNRTALDRLGRAPRLRRARLQISLTAVAFATAAVRRTIDLAVASTLSLLTAPLALAFALGARLRRRPALARETYLGRWQQPIDLACLVSGGPLARLPWLWAVVRGDLALVGPAPLLESQRDELGPADLQRFAVRPGLANLFAVRRSANIAFEGRTRADLEQVHAVGPAGEIGLLLRSVPAALIGGGPLAAPRELTVLGVRIDNWTMPEAVDWLLAPREGGTRQLAFVNPDCLNKAFEHESYRRVLASCDVVLPDGIGLHYALRMRGLALAANVNGTDLFPRLCDAASGARASIYFLGARPGVVDDLAAKVRERWPALRIAGTRHGFFARDSAEEREVIGAIRAAAPDLLLVAFGAPAQEEWLAAHRAELGVGAMLGVGGLFDFYSGRIRRAPAWLRELGLEWTWRLLQEPGRMWRRYVIGNPLFLWRAFRESRGVS